MKIEEYIESELSCIFWVKLVGKSIVFGSQGTKHQTASASDVSFWKNIQIFWTRLLHHSVFLVKQYSNLIWFMVKPQTSDIRFTYGYIRVTYRWHTSTYAYIRVTYAWHTSTYKWHTDDIRVTYAWHTSTYEWHTDDIRVIYGWHTSTYEWHTDDTRIHTSDIRVTYGWHTSTYESHTDDIKVHTSGIWVTYGWHVVRKKVNFKVNFFKAFW